MMTAEIVAEIKHRTPHKRRQDAFVVVEAQRNALHLDSDATEQPAHLQTSATRYADLDHTAYAALPAMAHQLSVGPVEVDCDPPAS